MIGQPKFEKQDLVSFTINGESKKGVIEIIDSYGTFENDSDVSYDIMVWEDNLYVLYKHISEPLVTLIRKAKDIVR